jgi:hypothetical protein
MSFDGLTDLVPFFTCMCAGAPQTVTVGGTESQKVLSNLTPGVTYQLTVISVKGQKESEPGSSSVTTGVCHTCQNTRDASQMAPYSLFSALLWTTSL